MLFSAAIKSNYFQWTPEHDVVEHCSITEFCSAAEI